MLNLLITLLLSASISYGKTAVWIDYDISFGKIIRDVDDGYALITALQSEDLDIKGISYGFGNIKNLKYMKKQTLKILKRLGREDIQIFEGARAQSEIFKATQATHAMANALKENPNLIIMAMGRLTNVASLAYNYPQQIANIKEVIINAGRRLEYETKVGKQQVIMPDTNVDDHLEAVKYVLESNIKITMIPVEVMKDKFITRIHLKHMRRGNSISKWMANNSVIWRWIWKLFPNSKGFIPWDVFIVTYVTQRDQFYCDEDIKIGLRYLKNNTSSLFRKKYKKDFKYFLVATNNMESKYRGNYCFRMNPRHLDNIVQDWSLSN